jgi:hypothetical protein
VNAGIEIHREYSMQKDNQWQLLKNPMKLSRGDLVRVDLFLSLPAARNFVVVDDPVPGSLEPVNRDLATASTVDADQGAFKAAKGSFWFKHGRVVRATASPDGVSTTRSFVTTQPVSTRNTCLPATIISPTRPRSSHRENSRFCR